MMRVLIGPALCFQRRKATCKAESHALSLSLSLSLSLCLFLSQRRKAIRKAEVSLIISKKPLPSADVEDSKMPPPSQQSIATMLKHEV